MGQTSRLIRDLQAQLLKAQQASASSPAAAASKDALATAAESSVCPGPAASANGEEDSRQAAPVKAAQSVHADSYDEEAGLPAFSSLASVSPPRNNSRPATQHRCWQSHSTQDMCVRGLWMPMPQHSEDRC